MIFARKLWHMLVAIKDGLALLFLLLFFVGLYALLTGRPGAGQVKDGALLLKLEGTVVEEPTESSPLAFLSAGGLPAHEYRERDLLRALDAAAGDKRIKAVVLDLGKFSGGSQVHMQELGAALDRVRAAKKPVLVWSLAYGDDQLLLAAHASEAWIDPMGIAFVLGQGQQTLYYGKLIERFKVTPHVYRVGTYKEYVEPYLRNDMSAPAREERTAVYAALFDSWKADVVKARPKAQLDLVTRTPAAWYQAAGGDGALAAKNAGLIDRIGDSVAFGKRVAEIAGADAQDTAPGSFAHASLKTFLAAHEPAHPGKAIGVITIAGEIVDGTAGPGKAGGDRIAELLDGKDAKNIAALVVRVDSPGGSVTAAERIRAAIERHKARGIPIVVSMANVAASGGYWVSTPASRIFAEPSTVTGSIGIFAVITSFEKTLADYGVTSDGVRTTPLSGQPDILGGFSPELDSLLQSTIEHGYRNFLGLVARARSKTPTQIDAVAQGRIWDGGTAQQLGLVDQFGSLDDALAYAAGAAKLETGKWHPLYLGEQHGGYQSLLEKLAGDSDSEPSSDSRMAGDLFAVISDRQSQTIARAMADARHMLGMRGAQAYCLGCPASGPPAPALMPTADSPAGIAGMIAWFRSFGLNLQ